MCAVKSAKVALGSSAPILLLANSAPFPRPTTCASSWSGRLSRRSTSVTSGSVILHTAYGNVPDSMLEELEVRSNFHNVRAVRRPDLIFRYRHQWQWRSLIFSAW